MNEQRDSLGNKVRGNEIRGKTRRVAYTVEVLQDMWEQDVEIIDVEMDRARGIVTFYVYHPDFVNDVPEGGEIPAAMAVCDSQSEPAFLKASFEDLD